MENTPSTFNKENKIRKVDLAESLQEELNQGLLSPEEREDLKNIIAEGSAKLEHKLTVNVEGKDPVVFDGTSDTEVNVDFDPIRKELEEHNHDDIYSKLDHEHNYAGSDTPGGSANEAKKVENPLEIISNGTNTTYDGSTPVSIEINPSGITQLSKKDFPAIGDPKILYIDIYTGIGYCFNADLNSYISVSFGNDKVSTLSANKNSLTMINEKSIEFDHIILTYKSEEEWLSSDPVLLKGEMGFVYNNQGNYKVGDGVKKFSELPYVCLAPSGTGTEIDDSKIPK